MFTHYLHSLSHLAAASRAYLAPEVLPRATPYTRSMLSRDAVSGMTVAAVLLPNTLAYAVLAGLPPVMGIYAALPAVIVAGLWGSSRLTVTAPVGIASLLVASSLTPFATPQSPQFITLAITLAVLVGSIQMLFGFFRLGILTRLISSATLVGFTNAAAIIIALAQLPTLVGILVPSGLTPFSSIYTLLAHAQTVHVPTLCLGVLGISIVFLGKYTAPKLPTSLLLIIAGLVVSYTGILNGYGIQTIGHIPAGLPQFSLDAFSLDAAFALLRQAVLIALVGFVSTYSISQALAKKDTNISQQKVDPNKELIGQGAANLFSGFFGGFPVSGSFSASALLARSRTASRVVFLVIATVMLLSLIFLAPFLSYIPSTLLAAVVIPAVLQLVDIAAFKHMYTLSRSDGIIAGITSLSALIVKPDEALTLGIVLTLAHFILRTMSLRMIEVGIHKQHNSLWARTPERADTLDVYPHTLVARLDSSLLFSNADTLETEVTRCMRTHEREHGVDLRAVVLNCSGMNIVDLSGIENMLALRDLLTEKGVLLAVMVVKDSALDQLSASGFFDSVQYINGTHDLREFCEAMEK